MFEQLAHDIKIVVNSPLSQDFKIGLINDMVTQTIERKTMSEPPQTEPQVVFSTIGKPVYFDVLTNEFKTYKEEN